MGDTLLNHRAVGTDMSDKTAKLGVGLTKAEKQRFRVEAAKRDMSMSELAREILLDALDEMDSEGESDPLVKPAD